MWRWIHPAVTAGLAITVVVLAARWPRTPPAKEQADGAGAGAAPRLPGPMIQEVPRSPAAFRLGTEGGSALDVRLFRYTCTYIDCRLEAEVAGEWVALLEVRAEALLHTREAIGQALKEKGGASRSRNRSAATWCGRGGSARRTRT